MPYRLIKKIQAIIFKYGKKDSIMSGKEKLIDTLGLGFILWLMGYLFSIGLYFYLPPGVLGWVLYVIFTPLTVDIAYWRFHKRRLTLGHYFTVAVSWTLIAVIFDYLFIVKLFNSQNYYAPDVFLYYITTFLIPLGIGSKYSEKKA